MGTLKSVCSSWFALISRDKCEHTHLRVPMRVFKLETEIFGFFADHLYAVPETFSLMLNHVFGVFLKVN